MHASQISDSHFVGTGLDLGYQVVNDALPDVQCHLRVTFSHSPRHIPVRFSPPPMSGFPEGLIRADDIVKTLFQNGNIDEHAPVRKLIRPRSSLIIGPHHLRHRQGPITLPLILCRQVGAASALKIAQDHAPDRGPAADLFSRNPCIGVGLTAWTVKEILGPVGGNQIISFFLFGHPPQAFLQASGNTGGILDGIGKALNTPLPGPFPLSGSQQGLDELSITQANSSFPFKQGDDLFRSAAPVIGNQQMIHQRFSPVGIFPPFFRHRLQPAFQHSSNLPPMRRTIPRAFKYRVTCIQERKLILQLPIDDPEQLLRRGQGRLRYRLENDVHAFGQLGSGITIIVGLFHLVVSSGPELRTQLEHGIGLTLVKKRLQLLPHMGIIRKIPLVPPVIVPGRLGGNLLDFLAQRTDDFVKPSAGKLINFNDPLRNFRKTPGQLDAQTQQFIPALVRQDFLDGWFCLLTLSCCKSPVRLA